MRPERVRTAWTAHFAGATSHLRPAVIATAAMLLSFGSGLLLERAARLNVDIVFLTVVLSMSLTRTQRGSDRRRRAVNVVVLPLVAVAAGEIGRVMLHHQNLGDTMFVVALSAGIWLRRFGALATRVGALVAMPFIALMVTPLPAPPTDAAPWWGAVATLIALAWSWITEALAVRVGFMRLDPAAAKGHAPAAKPAARRKGLPVSDRMALQMALSLGGAFALGRWLFPHHWPWMVLTAFIVTSGNRGRGDVVHKALLRFVGAATGTIAAALLAGLFPPHAPAAVGVILATLAVATWLRMISYAYWAGCVTAVLSVLYGYFGEDSAKLLPTRLEEIVLGALLAVAVAWFVFPIPTANVVRARVADALAALSDFLAAARHDPGDLTAHSARFAATAHRLGEVARPVTAHRRWIRRRGAHPADALEAVRGCVGPVGRIAKLAAEESERLAEPAAGKALGRTALGVGEARRSLVRRAMPAQAEAQAQTKTEAPAAKPDVTPAVPNPRRAAAGGTVHPDLREALSHIAAAMDTVRAVYRQPEPQRPEPPEPALPAAEAASAQPTSTGVVGVSPHSAQDPS